MLLLQSIMNTLPANQREMLEQEMKEYLSTKGWGPVQATQQSQPNYSMPDPSLYKFSICRADYCATTWTENYNNFKKLKEDYNWSSSWKEDVVFCVIQDKVIIAKATVHRDSKTIKQFSGDPVWKSFIEMNLFN